MAEVLTPVLPYEPSLWRED